MQNTVDKIDEMEKTTAISEIINQNVSLLEMEIDDCLDFDDDVISLVASDFG